MSHKRKKKTAKRRIPKQTKQEVLNEYHHKCYFCGSGENVELHHIIFRRIGGTNEPDNLIPLCDSCHKKFHSLVDPIIDYLLHKQ